MRARGDQRLDDALERGLAERGADALDLVAAARADLGGALDGHEGVVHAALLRLVREGRVGTAGASARGLALYARSGASGAATPTAAAARDPVAVHIASAVREPAARARVAADVAAHRAALAAESRAAAFGGERPTRALVKRADRGSRSVLLPQGLGDHVLRFVWHEGLWVLCALALFLLLHFFVAQVFVIPSDSMVPTLLRGDRVVVHKRGRGWVPERWRVVTYQRPGPDGPRTTYVKRVVGLPGERLSLWHGDAYADGRLLVKPDDLNAVLRSRLEAFEFGDGDARPEGWVAAPTMQGGTSWTYDVQRRPYWTGTYELERRFPVQDVYLELDVERAPGAQIELRLGRLDREGGAVHFAFGVSGGAFRLTRHDARPGASAPESVLASGVFAAAGRTTLELALVDGVLRARAGQSAWRGPVDAPVGAAWFGFTVDGDGTRPLALRVDQDLHYGVQGGLAVPGLGPAKGPEEFSHQIPADAVFCLGDNTADSRDSRFPEVGDIPLSQLIGPVFLRLWPPGRVGLPR